MIDNNYLENNRILAELNPQTKTSVLQTLTHLACLDGHFDDEEKVFITDLAHKWGLSDKETQKILTPENEADIIKNLKKIKDRRIGLQIIKELCFLGHADRNLSDEEILFIGHAGQIMGIEIDKIEEISDWVVDQIILREKGKLILEDC